MSGTGLPQIVITAAMDAADNKENGPWHSNRTGTSSGQGRHRHRRQLRHRPGHGQAVRSRRRQGRRRRPARSRAREPWWPRSRPPAAAAVALAGDVRSEAYAKALVALAVKTFGRLDVAFNNAGTLGEAVLRPSVSEKPAGTMPSPSTSPAPSSAPSIRSPRWSSMAAAR